jgi:hypothetical protein
VPSTDPRATTGPQISLTSFGVIVSHDLRQIGDLAIGNKQPVTPDTHVILCERSRPVQSPKLSGC